MYWWEDTIEEADECVLLIKTCRHAVEAARRRIAAMHPYQVPCIVGWDMDFGHPPFWDWLENQCATPDQR